MHIEIKITYIEDTEYINENQHIGTKEALKNKIRIKNSIKITVNHDHKCLDVPHTQTQAQAQQ